LDEIFLGVLLIALEVVSLNKQLATQRQLSHVRGWE